MQEIILVGSGNYKQEEENLTFSNKNSSTENSSGRRLQQIVMTISVSSSTLMKKKIAAYKRVSIELCKTFELWKKNEKSWKRNSQNLPWM